MEMLSTIRVGSRVYLKNAVAGMSGCVIAFREEQAIVFWPEDISCSERSSTHPIDSLIVDETYNSEHMVLDFGEYAA